MAIEGENKKNITLVVIIVCIIVVVIGYEVLGFGNKNDTVVVNQPKVEEVKKVEDNIEVYIVGCVNNPGVYEVQRGITVGKIVDKAGGFTEGADLCGINLVYKIKDNRMIVIKDKKERELEAKQRLVLCDKEKDKILKKTKRKKDGDVFCDDDEDELVRRNPSKKKSTSGGVKKKKVSKKDSTTKEEEEKKESNVAGSEDMPVVAPEKEISSEGSATVDKSTDETKVSDYDVVEKVKDLQKEGNGCNKQETGMEIIQGLYVDDDGEERTKVNINKASKAELMTLKGVGESMADKIIEYRESNGNFKDIDELKLVSGMGEGKFNKIKEDIDV